MFFHARFQQIRKLLSGQRICKPESHDTQRRGELVNMKSKGTVDGARRRATDRPEKRLDEQMKMIQKIVGNGPEVSLRLAEWQGVVRSQTEVTEITDYEHIWRYIIRQDQSYHNGDICIRQGVYFTQGRKHYRPDFLVLHKLLLKKIIQRPVIIYQRAAIYHEAYHLKGNQRCIFLLLAKQRNYSRIDVVRLIS